MGAIEREREKEREIEGGREGGRERDSERERERERQRDRQRERFKHTETNYFSEACWVQVAYFFENLCSVPKMQPDSGLDAKGHTKVDTRTDTNAHGYIHAQINTAQIHMHA